MPGHLVDDEDGFEVLVPAAPHRVARRVLVVLLAIAAIVGGVVGIRLLTESAAPIRITAYGAPVADPEAVLADAQHTFVSYVAARHGALGPDAKCWFQRPADSEDIGAALLCGPVQFYDDQPSTPYLRFSLIAHGTGSPLDLEAAQRPTTPALVAAAAGTTLVRPDGTSDPLRTAGVPPPIPPAADPDTLTLTDAVHPSDLAPAPPSAVIGGDEITLRLVEYGAVDRFGTGVHQQSAPADRQLFAFRLAFAGGENGFALLTRLDLAVSVGAEPLRPLHLDDVDVAHTGQLFVVATPPTAPLWLVLTEHGVTQRLSLRDGSPGSGNVRYLPAPYRVEITPFGRQVPATLTTGGTSKETSVFVWLDHADLQFFEPGTGVHPQRTDHVFLHLDLYYIGAQAPSARRYTSPTGLTLTPRGGTPIRPSAVSDTGPPVFEIPLDMTDATVTIAGSRTEGDATLTIRRPVRFLVHLVLDD